MKLKERIIYVYKYFRSYDINIIIKSEYNTGFDVILKTIIEQLPPTKLLIIILGSTIFVQTYDIITTLA